MRRQFQESLDNVPIPILEMKPCLQKKKKSDMESSGFVWMRPKSRIQHKSSAVSLKSVARDVDLTQMQFSPSSLVIQDVLALLRFIKPLAKSHFDIQHFVHFCPVFVWSA